VDEFCQSALQKNMVSLGFSAHAPVRDKLGRDTDWHLAPENYSKYKAAVLKARADYGSGGGRISGNSTDARPLRVFLGLEVDYIKDYISPADPDIQSLTPDYIIGSVHWVLPPGAAIDWADAGAPAGMKPPPCVDGSEADFEFLLRKGFDGDADALVRAYMEAETEMCEKGGFDVLGHCDLIKKNNKDGRYFPPDNKKLTEHAQRLAEVLAQTNIVAEVNTGGMNRGKTRTPYPSAGILKIFRSFNIPVTINADAHTPAELCGNYEAALAALRGAGYKHFLVFRGKNHWEEAPVTP